MGAREREKGREGERVMERGERELACRVLLGYGAELDEADAKGGIGHDGVGHQNWFVFLCVCVCARTRAF